MPPITNRHRAYTIRQVVQPFGSTANSPEVHYRLLIFVLSGSRLFEKCMPELSVWARLFHFNAN